MNLFKHLMFLRLGNYPILAILIPFITINLFPIKVDAANLTMAQYRIWCEQTKGGMVEEDTSGSGIPIKKCLVDGREIPDSTVFFAGRGGVSTTHCLCDSNGNGQDDRGDEVKRRHQNRIVGLQLDQFQDLLNPSPEIDPLILSSLNDASQSLFASTEFNIWVAITLNDLGNLEMAVDLRDVPTLDRDPRFADEGFTEMNLIYRDEMGSLSGINLVTLNQGQKDFLEFDPNQFEPFGGFSAWQLGVTIYNPTTAQHILVFEDVKVPESSSILALLSLGTLGVASTLTRKLKPSKEKQLEKVS